MKTMERPHGLKYCLYFGDELGNCIVRYVHEHAEITILALSKQLARNYRNVYQDVKDLSQMGLMVKNVTTNKYSVPWNAIVTEISLSSYGKKSGKVPHAQAR